MSGFVIFALPVSDGILAIAPMPGRGGHYAEDLAHLRDWQPALVITMTSLAEMARHGAQGLGADLQDAGTRWAHVPVTDYGVPSITQEDAWHEASRAALAALHGGGRVLIHCAGGCGRSGMAALRLMIEAGEPVDTALARLRGVRPCAVETEDQLDWATKA
ncbi:protein phosphatase [Roseovarius sp. MMSF_3281]|uniref:protein-tyrosine phosphatase family protein n=1 Tax=Roseovarius sp. MMSF_3281 TaxID=3046694 RepID=UPI00273EDE5D|nr:protein phosphatase [Roseovarius sp. MMSF_3281]